MTDTITPNDDVVEALKDVVDPELGINVVDLGLVYGVQVDDSNIATIDLTLTSAACPLTDVIEDQTMTALVGVQLAAPSRRLQNRSRSVRSRLAVWNSGAVIGYRYIHTV